MPAPALLALPWVTPAAAAAFTKAATVVGAGVAAVGAAWGLSQVTTHMSKAEEEANKKPATPIADAASCCPSPDEDPDDNEDKKEPTEHEKELGTDPATGRYSQAEADAGLRLEQRLGTRLSRSPDSAYDFVDATGKTYDAVGPAPSQYFQSSSFNNAINSHLNKQGLNYTVVDTTGLNGSQVSSVSRYISELSPAQQSRIIQLGPK